MSICCTSTRNTRPRAKKVDTEIWLARLVRFRLLKNTGLCTEKKAQITASAMTIGTTRQRPARAEAICPLIPAVSPPASGAPTRPVASVVIRAPQDGARSPLTGQLLRLP